LAVLLVIPAFFALQAKDVRDVDYGFPAKITVETVTETKAAFKSTRRCITQKQEGA